MKLSSKFEPKKTVEMGGVLKKWDELGCIWLQLNRPLFWKKKKKSISLKFVE